MPPNGVQEQNFQPQVRDTSNGPHVHTYIPRSDGFVDYGGVNYVPQAGGVPIPITPFPGAGIHSVGVGPAATVTPVAIQAGGGIQAVAPPLVPVTAPVAVAAPVQVQQPAPVIPLVYQQPPYPVGYPVYPNQPYPYQHYQQQYPHGCGTVAYNPYPQYPYPVQNNNPNGLHFTNHVQQPAMGYLGLTGSENTARQLATVHGTKMNEKQEMKPADPDPLRMYWVRELDNTYTHHNRLTIESGDIGQCRWYTIDGGIFYAVRLPSS